MRTPQIVVSPIGRDRPAISIPGVEQIRGILIDNPSGAWLLLRPTNDYIPPYTINFARSFEGGLTAVSLEFPISGPAGQVTTFAGDPPVIILDTQPVAASSGASSGGSSFIQQFTPLQVQTPGGSAAYGLGVTGDVVYAGVANKRWRLRSYEAHLMSFLSIPSFNANGESGYQFRISGNLAGSPDIYGHVGPAGQSGFSTGVQNVMLDWAVGDSIFIDVAPDWCDIDYGFTFAAELI